MTGDVQRKAPRPGIRELQADKPRMFLRPLQDGDTDSIARAAQHLDLAHPRRAAIALDGNFARHLAALGNAVDVAARDEATANQTGRIWLPEPVSGDPANLEQDEEELWRAAAEGRFVGVRRVWNVPADVQEAVNAAAEFAQQVEECGTALWAYEQISYHIHGSEVATVDGSESED